MKTLAIGRQDHELSLQTPLDHFFLKQDHLQTHQYETHLREIKYIVPFQPTPLTLSIFPLRGQEHIAFEMRNQRPALPQKYLQEGQALILMAKESTRNSLVRTLLRIPEHLREREVTMTM